MPIQNFKSLGTSKAKKNALKILEAGLSTAEPKNFLKFFINKNEIHIGKSCIILSNYEKIFVVSYGKAADSMAKFVSELLNVSQGIVVIPKYTKSRLTDKNFKIFYSGHPLPDRESVRAGKAVLKFVNNCSNKDLIIFLISGGGSSLLSVPEEITLSDKKRVTKLLLHCGATINEFNCVRKHLSQIKGGKLIQKMKCDGCALIMSDVVNNDISVISSGCTSNDKTTSSDALKIIRKYSLETKFPKKAITHLKKNVHSKTIIQKNLRIKNEIIATNQDCLDAMVSKSQVLGFKTVLSPVIRHNVVIAAKKLVKAIPRGRRSCMIFGGEPTVNLKGKGKGGRNQELVLQILKLVHKSNRNLIISSIGTDGIDGNTKYAGALVENDSFKLEDIIYYLKNNNSNLFFKKHNGLIKTGYTHTNLMDFGLILKY